MRERSLTSFGSLFISVFAASIATVSAGIFTETSTVATSSPTTSTSISQTIFLTPHPAGDPKALSGFLMAHPDMKLTLLFPPVYFDGPERKPTLKNFQLLQSSQQIEIGLTLDNQPMLPLIADLSTGGAVKWNIPFVWPEDVAAQIARGSAGFQRRWGTLPSGFVPPYFALSEAVLETLKRFRMNWVLTASNEIPGVRFHSSLAVITPPALPVWDSKDLRSWANDAAAWTLSQPLVYLDASQQADPLTEIKFLESLAKKRGSNGASTLILAQDLVREFPDAQTLPKDSSLFRYDYSGWTVSQQQKKAWTALADARKTLDAYQSSGRANLQRLDAAVEEMCNAESGPFLLELGASTAMDAERERSFSATLANVYRLCEKPVPTTLNIWFGGRAWQKTGPATKSAQQDGPFFTSMTQNFTWNDAKDDDNGAGAYAYPAGPYPKGMFDLRSVNIQWNESTVDITISVSNDFSRKALPIVPLADLYIDVNKLADAGSTAGLERRGTLNVEREAAWEYAVSMSPLKAILYQAVPGSQPRILSTNEVKSSDRSWTASISRTKLRGDPKRWRMSIALMGTDNSQQAIEPAPVTFRSEATDRNFGGAPKSRVAPVIDLLAPSAEEQATIIGVNVEGGPLTLPFVEAQ